MGDEPTFDPSKPFDVVSDATGGKPVFDPSLPFEVADSTGTPKKTSGSTLSGIAKAVPSGVVRGLASAAGFVPDVLKAVYGSPNEGPNPIGSAALTAKVEPYLHQNQGPAEEIASRIGENLPLAAFGPESLAARVGYNAVAPAVAGYAAEKAGAGPLGSAAAAFASPLAARGIVGGVNAIRAGRAAAASAPDIADFSLGRVKEGRAGFDAARAMNPTITPDVLDRMVAATRAANKDFDQRYPTTGHIDDLEKLAAPVSLGKDQNGKTIFVRPNVDMNDVETIRKRISGLRTNADDAIRKSAQDAHEALSKVQMGLTDADTLQNNGSLYSQTLRKAMDDWAQGKRGLTIAGKQSLTDLKTLNKGSGADVDNTTRQVMTALARPVNNTNMPVWKKMGFSNEEGAAIEAIAKGTPYGNAMRYFGKYAPSGAVSTASAMGIGHIVAGPFGTILPAVGYVAKKLGDMDTQSRVKALHSLIMSGSKLGPQVAAALGPDVTSQLPKASQNILSARNAFQAARAGTKGYGQAKRNQGKR